MLLRRRLTNPGRSNEKGLIITLVAIFMLGVVGAMAALAIDITSLYTARSEAQLAADGAALAGARALANSGMTSDPNALTDSVATNAVIFATAVATQVAASNQVGGRNLSPTAGTPCSAGEICVSINTGDPHFIANPQVTVTVQRTDLPTFFARIWGTTAVAVKATATAEAYNPSTLPGSGATEQPVAPICVKPWLLPNLDPNSPGKPIFKADGEIQDNGLLGWETQQPRFILLSPNTYLAVACPGGDCSSPANRSSLNSLQYFPGDPADFPSPAATSVTCSPNATGFIPTPYQLSVAGCVQAPIACNQSVGIDTATDATRDYETASAVNCLTHAATNKGDSVDQTNSPIYPFEFLAGDDNQLVQGGTLNFGTDTLVSDSLVTVPVFDTVSYNPSVPSATIVGFVQLFLNPEGHRARIAPPGANQLYQVHTMVINMVGCGTSATGTRTVYGNGPSAVAVRLITPPSS